ncbi:hypothetical protein [Polymorphospora rubra]|uniref:hypothetical protein n=1 Tax=Polymorphospora rubra TaxID=338584 RepID=UPI0033DD8B4D
MAGGRWQRICRGVLLGRPGQITREQHHWVAVLAAGPGAVLAGLAAARAGGLRLDPRHDVVDVLVPAGRRRADLLGRLPLGLPAVRVRRTGALPVRDRQRGRPDRTSMARSVVDAAQWASTDDDARTVVAAACQQRRTTPGEILTVLGRMPRTRRRALAVRTANDVAGGAQALSEIDFVRLCRRYLLPRPDLQERRTDAAGRNRYLDAYWRDWRLHVEVDGAHHMDVREWAADMRRQNEVWIGGDRVLRFPPGSSGSARPRSPGRYGQRCAPPVGARRRTGRAEPSRRVAVPGVAVRHPGMIVVVRSVRRATPAGLRGRSPAYV